MDAITEKRSEPHAEAPASQPHPDPQRRAAGPPRARPRPTRRPSAAERGGGADGPGGSADAAHRWARPTKPLRASRTLDVVASRRAAAATLTPAADAPPRPTRPTRPGPASGARPVPRPDALVGAGAAPAASVSAWLADGASGEPRTDARDTARAYRQRPTPAATRPAAAASTARRVGLGALAAAVFGALGYTLATLPDTASGPATDPLARRGETTLGGVPVVRTAPLDLSSAARRSEALSPLALAVGSFLATGRWTETTFAAPPRLAAAPAGPTTLPVTLEQFEELVRENLRLGAEVVSLEDESMSLQQDLLTLELRLFAAGLPLDTDLPTDAGAPAAAPATVAEAPPRDATDVMDLALEEPTYAEDAPYAEEPDYAYIDDTIYGEEPDWSELEGEAGADSGQPSSMALYADESDALRPLERIGPDEALASGAMGAPQQRLVIAEVPAGGVGQSVGLLPGDIVLSIDGREVIGMDDVYASDDGSGGQLHELEIVRDGMRFPVMLAASPADLRMRLDWVEPVFAR